MINRIKNWDIKNLKINDKQVISLALIFSIMALVMAIPSSSNCASANTCTVASTGTFTGNLGIRSNTVYQLTQQHNLAVDQIANWEAVGGNHTGSVIMKDNNGDFNLNGGLVLGTSSTSTLGTVRFSSDKVQVLNSTGSFVDVGGTPTNDIGQVTGDTGSFTAATQQDNINVVGGTGITTSVTGDTLTIASSGGGYNPQCGYYAYLNSGYTPNNPNGVNINTEYVDNDNCFTISANSTGSTITYTDSTTRVFQVSYNLRTSNSLNYVVAIQVGRNQPSSPKNYASQLWNTSATSVTSASTSFICLEQNNVFELGLPSWTNGIFISGAIEKTYIMLLELPELSAYGQTQGCTQGEFD